MSTGQDFPHVNPQRWCLIIASFLKCWHALFKSPGIYLKVQSGHTMDGHLLHEVVFIYEIFGVASQVEL